MSEHSSVGITRPPEGWQTWAGLLLFLALCFGVAIIGGMVSSSSVSTWYPTLVKPPFNPPDWIFGPVWSILYLLIAISGWRVWLRRGFSGASGAMALFGGHLIANLAWTLIFFGLRSPGLALIDVALLLILIALNIRAFSKIDGTAANLLWPYFGWVCFAAILNFSIWVLN